MVITKLRKLNNSFFYSNLPFNTEYFWTTCSALFHCFKWIKMFCSSILKFRIIWYYWTPACFHGINPRTASRACSISFSVHFLPFIIFFIYPSCRIKKENIAIFIVRTKANSDQNRPSNHSSVQREFLRGWQH